MKEIAEEPSLRKTGTVVEVDHPTRGKYLTVGNPIKMSDSISEVKRSPLLGEHTDEILKDVLKLSSQGHRRDQGLRRPERAEEGRKGGVVCHARASPFEERRSLRTPSAPGHARLIARTSPAMTN